MISAVLGIYFDESSFGRGERPVSNSGSKLHTHEVYNVLHAP